MAIKERNKRRKQLRGEKAASSGYQHDAEFASAEEVPEAQTISELKQAKREGAGAAKPSAPESAKKTKKRAGQTKSSHRDTSLPFGQRVRLRLGERTTGAVVLLIRSVLFVLLALVTWLLSLGVAASVVPDVVGMVATASGAESGSLTEEGALIYVGLPSLFLIGLLFVLVCVVIRALWRIHLRIGDKAARALSA